MASAKCYCNNDATGKWCLTCDSCHKYIHKDCLQTTLPTLLAEDIFFDVICRDCTGTGQEQLNRMNLQWATIVHLILYDMHVKEPGRQFFRWRDICSNIEKNWSCLFGNRRKKVTNGLTGTVAGVLSHNFGGIFQSGSSILQENGWWRLREISAPSVAEAKALLNKNGSRRRKKRSCADDDLTAPDVKRQKRSSSVDTTASSSQASGSQHDLTPYIKVEPANHSDDEEIIDVGGSSGINDSHQFDFLEPPPSLLMDFRENDMFFNDVLPPNEMVFREIDSIFNPTCLSDTFCDSDLWDSLSSNGCLDSEEVRPGAETAQQHQDNFACDHVMSSGTIKSERAVDSEWVNEPKQATSTRPDPSSESVVNEEPVGEPAVSQQVKCEDHVTIKTEPTASEVVSMSVHEERALLELLQNSQSIVDQHLDMRRLLCKLRLREIKRQRGLPLWDVDQLTRQLMMARYKERGIIPLSTTTQEMNDPLPDKAATSTRQEVKENRILDRFQLPQEQISRHAGAGISLLNRLVGLEDHQLPKITSPYTGRILKPFIWRDDESLPLKLRLIKEIQAYPHQGDSTWVAPPSAPIDYCYVQPQHIPPVNALCREFFWPGIDLSECLQYPDFSCVALYRKFVIGFAFMVPDVAHNEAYISFLFTHPEWRNCGIAKFMLYHLIQTCMGKDVTLHVSATNTAMLLYQKFGFKQEEFILNFYDKYFPVASNESRHAFFLRLRK